MTSTKKGSPPPEIPPVPDDDAIVINSIAEAEILVDEFVDLSRRVNKLSALYGSRIETAKKRLAGETAEDATRAETIKKAVEKYFDGPPKVEHTGKGIKTLSLRNMVVKWRETKENIEHDRGLKDEDVIESIKHNQVLKDMNLIDTKESLIKAAVKALSDDQLAQIGLKRTTKITTNVDVTADV